MKNFVAFLFAVAIAVVPFLVQAYDGGGICD